MLATNEPVCPSFVHLKNFRAFRQARRLALLSLALCVAAVPARAQVAGQNVNMVSGTDWTNGDPFLQRQNEPSIAVSSRNPSHLLAGANDYRTVDLPGLLGIDERGDAWLGLFKSFDSGRRWQSTLLPGFPLDGSSEGLASPIHGFQAASDPTVRAGTNGLFYYTGIAYNRGPNPLSAVFIARFIDLNNKENGSATFESGSMTNLAPRDTIKYIDTQIIGKGTSNVFIDKPWLAVDIPRGNSTCTFSVNQDGKTITQTVPAGPVYVTYTSFVGSGAKQFSQILFRRSLDCGATWSAPVVLSRNNEPFGDAEHQGTVIAIDPSVPSTQPATIYVAWRRFANLNDPDDAPAIFVAKSTDGGRHWAPPVPIVLFPQTCVKNPLATGCPYDQDFTTASFRSNGYPAMTVDRFGKVYIAWSQRDANGDGKIMMGVSPSGTYFPAGSVAQVDIGSVTDDNGASFSNLSGRGSQLMPSLGFANDRLTLVYYDLRQDHTTGIYVPAPDPGCDPMVTLPCTLGAQYFENRAFEGELAPPSPFNNPAVFSPNISDSNPPLTIRRHTIDIMGAQADPFVSSLQVPSFKTFRVSHYEFGSVPALFPDVEQLQYNVPNLPLFVDGTAPFMGDYIDITGTPQIVPTEDGDWIFNVTDTGTAVFHTAWTDNRDVIPPADGNWRHYTPPISASNPGSQLSKFDPTTNPPTCVVGQTGMRNQNVYTAEISSGVILTSPQTSKPVLTPTGQPVQREFVVELRNATNAARSFLVTIPAQPPSATASFQQFTKQVAQTVKVNAFSSQSFPVFVMANVGSNVAFPSVLINAVENDGALTPLSGSILLNPDPTNPALANPDNVTVGANQISLNEFYNPGLANPGLANPGLANSGIANPGLANPGLANPGLANPQVITALNPGLANPGLANPGLANPGLANPGLANQALTDVSYTITNEGNTSASYTVQFFQSGNLPQGAQFQIILSKLYFTQQAVGCQVQQVPTNVIVANVTNPAFVTNPNQLGNPGLANLGLQTPTLNLAPGDSGQITLRTNLTIPQVQSLLLPNLSPVAVSQAVNTVDVKQGITTPPISLIITSTSASLPVGVVNQTYNTTLTSIGGNTGPRIWTITAGSLPPGLQLNAASGAIAGTPTQTGSFPFTAQVVDTGTPQHTATRDLVITIVPPVAITTPSPTLAGGVLGSQYAQIFSAAGGVPPYTWSSTGTLPPGLTLSNTGTLSGMPTTPGTYSFTVTATDSIGLFATASYTILVANQPAQITFVVQPSNSVGSQAISPAVQVQVLDVTGAVISGVQVAMNFGNPACSTAVLSGSPLATTNVTGIATFSNLMIDRGQVGYTLLATAGNATAVSNPFTVNGFCPTSKPLNTPRVWHSAVTLRNGSVLIAGGSDASGLPISSAELYSPVNNAFTSAGVMNSARWAGTATLLNNGTVLLTGGVNSPSNVTASVTSSAEIYNPLTGTFVATAGAMNSPRFAHTATLLADGRVLLVGGGTSLPAGCLCPGANTYASIAETYDPITGTFTPTANSPSATRQFHTATLLPNGQVLIAGGSSGNAQLSSAEIFDPVSNTFHPTATMNSPHDFHAGALLPTGLVLIAGGFSHSAANRLVATQQTETYDPSTSTFLVSGSLLSPRAEFSATVLPDGTVLLPAGINDVAVFVNSAETYSPSSGTSTATGSLSSASVVYALAQLQDGTVLITGGATPNGITTDAEIYYSTAPLAPLVITTASLPNGATGQPYTQVLLEQGGVGTLTWTVSGGLPAGMNFSNQGVLTGTPTVGGSFSLTFTLADSSAPAKTVSANFTLTVANSPLVFTSSTVPTAVAGKPYSQPIPVVGGTQPYNATAISGTLPPGLLLTTNGMLNGTPSGTGTFSFTVTVTDSSTPTKAATQTLTITVNTLVITTTVLPNGIVGVLYNATIATAGGTLPLSFSLANTAFPPGLLIQQPSPGSSGGALAGTPTLAGTYTFSESVVDSSNPRQTATQNYVVTIVPAGSAVPAKVTFGTQPQNSVGGQTLKGGPLLVQVTDANNAPIPGTTVAMSLSGLFGAQVPCSIATLTGTLSAVTDATGQATFSNLSIDRGGFNYTLIASTGSASSPSGPFSVQGFCPTGNLSTQRELHTQVLLGTAKSIVKFPLDPKGAYIFTNTNPAPPGLPDVPNSPLIIPLASLGLVPGSVISGVAVGDVNVCGFAGEPCFGEFYDTFVCGVFSSSNTLLPSGGTINRVPGAIAPNFNTAFPCFTGTTAFGGLATDIPQDFGFFGEQVTVPPGAAYLFVALADTFYADNLDPNRDFGLQLTINSPATNGKVLIAGGVDNLNNAVNTAELYDPATGTTSPTGNLSDPNGRVSHISVLLPNGKVLLAGGQDNISGALTTAELYDPAAGTFSPTGSMMHPRILAEAVLLADGRVLVTGGSNTNVGSNTAEIYDPVTGLWTPTGNMTQGRIRHRMTLLPNGKVLVTGGRDAALNFFGLSSAELFDPFANQGAGAFTAIGNMNSVRFVHGQSLLSNGTVLVAGGFDNTGLSVTSAEIFDPATNLFTLTGNLNIGRSRHSSTVLPDGSVLETGGIDSRNGFTPPAPAELYLPTGASFALTGSMTTGRELAGATLLPNGNVLVAGGDDAVNVLQSTELYFNPVVKEPIVITTTSIANGFISQPYVQLLLEQNSSGPVTWSLTSGTLPPGISLGGNGILIGTPTATGSFAFTAQVTDGISTASASFTINVSLVTLSFTANSMPSAGAGKPYSQPLPVVGGTQPYTATVTSGTLPPGLALGSNGVLSGTPSSAGSFTFTSSVSDSSTPVQTATQTLTIAVDTLFITTTALPGGMVNVPYNAVISTTGGTLPLTFSAANAAFPPGLAIQQPALNSPSGALAGMPTTAGHFTFTESVVDSSTPAQTATQYYVMDIFPAGTTGVPASAIFLSQPQNSVGGQILTGSPIRVRFFDASNTPVVGASVAMSFNGTPPCSSAVLSGTLTAVTNGNGVAVFPDLSIDRGQLGYTLLANAGSASAISQPFTVNGFCATGSMSTARVFHSSVTLPNGMVLIAGGTASFNASLNSAFSSAELYNPATRSFTTVGGMHAPRELFTMTLLQNGLVLVTGGYSGSAQLSSAELFDPSTNAFTLLSNSMTAQRYLHSATLLANGKVLITGGGAPTNALQTAELFDPASNTFTATRAQMTVPRSQHHADLLADGKVLVTGGENGNFTPVASAELYDPMTDTFAATGNMFTPRDTHATALLSNGIVLVAGGFTGPNNTSPTAAAELYDPSSGQFVATGNALAFVGGFSSSSPTLPDGTVFVEPGALNAEIYDPILGNFRFTGNMAAFQGQPETAMLADGTGLVTGGVDSNQVGVAAAEIYYSTAPFAPLKITTPSVLRGATQGQPYAQVLLEQGGLGALTWTLTGGSLPSGITLSPHGILSGTPTVFGAFLFTVQVTDSSVPPKTATTSYALLVNPFFQFFGTQLLTAFSGVAYNNALPLIGGTPPYSSTLSSGVLPSGLMLANDVISGTTTAVGTYTLTFQATDSSVPPQSAIATLTLGVTTPLAITTTTLPGGVLNSPYNATIATSGGLGTIIIAPTANALPPGLTMDLHGVISGTPTQTGTFNSTVVAVDQSFPPQTFTQPESITITNPAPAGAHIVFIIQPGQNSPNGLQALAQLFDANNAPVPGVQLTGSFGNKACPDAALSGTVTAITDSSGLAAFSGISSNRGGNGYTAVASVTSNPQVFATSVPFNIQGSCPTGNLTTLRREDTVAILPNDKVLILGGLNSNSVSAATPLNTAELYDPATGVFTATGNMTTTRDLATATLLPNGKVLVVGGRDATGAQLATAEIYDPATGVFTATGSMSVPRQEFTATLLPNGKVLIAGGAKWSFPTTFYASAETYDPATGAFTPTGAMNSPHVDHTATLLPNGKVLLASGLGSVAPDGSNQQLTTIAELYDSSTGAFTLTGSMAVARENHAATLLASGQVLISGGYSAPQPSAATASAEIYDPAAGTFSPTGNMNVARAEHTSTLLPNGTVLIGGGFSSGGFFAGVELSTAEIYNPLSGNFKGPANMAFAHSRIVAPLLPNGAVLLASGTTAEQFFPADPPFLVQEFTATGSLNAARNLHTATPLSNGLVLIAGGADSSGGALASAELYNPISGTFTATGILNTARVYHTATLLSNGLVLIAGGTLNSSGSSIPSASAELYNPGTGTFTATGSMNSARAYHTATLLNNGLVLVAGGLNSSGIASASAELYNPATGTFTATGSLNTGRLFHTATTLNNGLVLIAGGLGSSSGPFLANAELYNPATGTFTATGSLNTARQGHTATLLNNGIVLIAGGLSSSGTALASAELYNPASGTFIATGSLNTGRWVHTATLLSNGLVLFAGGFSSSVGALASAELYDPASGIFTAAGNLNTAREFHSATLLSIGKVLVSGGTGNTGVQATSELYQFGANQQLQPQSCSYEGHIKSVAAFSTPAAIQFVNASTTLSFQVFWLDYNGNRVLYATLAPGQSLVQQTFLTHPWVIADTSPAATCQHIYLPLPEQAPAIFP